MDVKTYPFIRSDEEWRRELTPEQYRVMRAHGTERPGSCALLHEKRAGAFTCAGCGQKLFRSDGKFESGTGWPSFGAPLEARRWKVLSKQRWTEATAWSAPRSIAPIAAAIWAMSSMTARCPPGCATASTAWPWISHRQAEPPARAAWLRAFRSPTIATVSVSSIPAPAGSHGG